MRARSTSTQGLRTAVFIAPRSWQETPLVRTIPFSWASEMTAMAPFFRSGQLEAVQVGTHFPLGGGVCLGEDRHFLAGNPLERQFDVGMRAILVGRIPECDALVVAGAKQVGKTLRSEFARLVGTAADTVGAAAHGQPADLYFARPEKYAIGGVFLGSAGKEMIGEGVKGSTQPGCLEKMSPIHGSGSSICNGITERAPTD